MLKRWWRSLMVGENHWSAAILKRALANDLAWHRLSEKSLPICKRCYPNHRNIIRIMRFALSIHLPELAASVAVLNRLVDSAASEWNKHAVRTYKANHYCDPATHHFNEDIRDITPVIKKA